MSEAQTVIIVESPTPTVVVNQNAPSTHVSVKQDPAPIVSVKTELPRVVVSSVGVQGPPGPAGQDGGGGGGGTTTNNFYAEYSFASPSTKWIIFHNQHTFGLNVQTFSTSGEVIDGNIEYPDNNTITVDWYYPMGGIARVFN